jgi:hypothetical protein
VYFRNSGWEAGWVRTAREIVEEEYEQNYENLDVAKDVSKKAVEQPKKVIVYANQLYLTHTDNLQSDSTKHVNHFDELPSLAPLPSVQASNELQQYLETDPENVKDAIAWWHEHHATYPRLSQMAIDYLTIPGKSSLIHV